MSRAVTWLALVLVVSTSGLASAGPAAGPTTGPLSLLWIEHGGNLESLGNERIIVRYDRSIVYERGRGVAKKDPKYGTVTVGACDRYTGQLSEAEQAALNGVISAQAVATLEPSYRNPAIEDGSQAGLLLRLPQRTVSSSFDNQFPPAYRALMLHLREHLLSRLVKAGKPGRCDPATWIFITPPAR